VLSTARQFLPFGKVNDVKMKNSILKIIGILIMFMALNNGVMAQSTSDMTKTGNAKKFIEMITGTWKLKSIVDAESKGQRTKKRTDSKNGTIATKNPPDQSNNAMEIMEFEPDARYKMNTAVTAVDSGSFRINEQHGVLYLDSDKSGDPSEWTISIKNNVLTLGGRSDADKRYTYVYERIKKGVNTK
jgi:hypothetical protein